MGGGKSYWLRWECVYFLMRVYAELDIKNVIVGLFCEDYPALKDRQLSKIATEFPDWMGKHHADHKDYGNCYILAPEYGSGVIAFRNLDEPSKYKSAEFAVIAVDELTRNPIATFDDLRTRLRYPGLGDRVRFLAGTNPGDIGHGWVRSKWGIQGQTQTPDVESHKFFFIQALAEDNPHLTPEYKASLYGISDEGKRKAYANGDWAVFQGQAFPEICDRHKFKDAIDPNWHKYISMDWGYAKPYAIGFYALDYDGRLWLYKELYGDGGQPNVGSQEPPEDVAKRVKDSIGQDKIEAIYAGPDWFFKTQLFFRGRSLAEVFAEFGLHLTQVSTPGGSRLGTKAILHGRLKVDVEHEDKYPGLVVHESCKHWWRTVPMLTYKDGSEDIDTDQEDHHYDQTRLIVSSHQWIPRETKPDTRTDRQRWRDERKKLRQNTERNKF